MLLISYKNLTLIITYKICHWTNVQILPTLFGNLTFLKDFSTLDTYKQHH